MSPDRNPTFVSLSGAAKRLGVGRNAARAMARQGLFASILLPGMTVRRYGVGSIDRVFAAAVVPAVDEVGPSPATPTAS